MPNIVKGLLCAQRGSPFCLVMRDEMAGITLAQAEQHLSEWILADSAVATGQSYTIGGKTLTRANAREIRENITYWDQMVRKLSRGGIKIIGATPT